MGFVGDLFGGSAPQTTTTLDPDSQRFVTQQLRPAAIEAANLANQGQFIRGPLPGQLGRAERIGRAGVGLDDPRLQRFLQNAQGGAAQNFGLATQAFDPSRIQDFLSPFTENVIGGIRGEFDFLRDQAGTAVDQEATASGARGGSRQFLERGARLGELDRAQASQVGQALERGFGQAAGLASDLFQGRAGRAAGIGGQQFGSILPALQFGTGTEFQREHLGAQLDEQLRALHERQSQAPLFAQQQRLSFLGQGIGPTGQTTTSDSGSNPLGSALGGGLAGAQVGGPLGAVVGGGIGLLSGLF